MPKNPGWKARDTSGAPPIHSGVLPDGSLQSFYFPDNHPHHSGQFKGMAQILQEQGINVDGKHTQCEGFKCADKSAQSVCCCQRILFNQPDFQAQKSAIEELVEGYRHKAVFYPKFYCELNFIEQC
ncbi:uncharacterized protein FOMMEDRAFT_74537 [Fomitiporia mediterranea MF3/22]|uniref:uncharacterized protein n=1 Tax=Fomitiporia mediterranea (strain MF3/22) TaxID=694068 RepID=UPI00044093FB|nr:uncharacterized protein FOMMEDRAFT_74537 [Fomitiporia mediterranea MF3/22]EJD07984.1 hypothetical protein FOMMEDRAFT_74537 [Fomitiporia mediterranea MF3/22]